MFEKLDNFLKKTEAFILSSTIILITLTTTVNVISRYIFKRSISATEELCMFFIVISTFIGSSYASREGLHIYMGILINSKRLSTNLRRFFVLLVSLATSILSFYLVVLGYSYVKLNYIIGKTSSTLDMPWYIVSICFPVGFFLMGIHWIRIFFMTIRKRDSEPSISLENR